MNKIVKKEWSELQPIWNGLLNANPVATPFQSYEYLSFTGKGKPSHKAPFRLCGVRELNVVLYSDNKPIAIAPMLYKKKKGRTTVYLRGHFTALNQLDFIYADLCYDDFKFLMDGIRKLLGDVSFFFNRIYYLSPTRDYLKQYLPSAEMQTHEGFAIRIPQEYDDWYNSLSKSVCATLRLSRNRITKDEIQCATSFYVGDTIDSDTYEKMLSVYVDRFLVKNNIRLGPLQKLAKMVLRFYVHKEKMMQWIKTTDHSFHVVVYMNNQIAAFASGLLCKNKRMIGSKLAINSDFKRYSPGAVLIRSSIEYLSEQKKSNGITIDLFDMGRGGEGGMAYKRSYGGEPYYNYTFIE